MESLIITAVVLVFCVGILLYVIEKTSNKNKLKFDNKFELYKKSRH